MTTDHAVDTALSVEETQPDQTTESTQVDGEEVTQEPEKTEPTLEERLKKLEKSNERKSKAIDRKTWELAQTKRELESLKSTASQVQEKPKTLNDFNSPEEYVEYVALQAASKTVKDYEGKTASQRDEFEKQVQTQQRVQNFQTSIKDLEKSNPEMFKSLMSIPQGIEFPDHVKDEIYKSDNPALLAAALVHEDLIEDLLDSDERSAARMIGRVESRLDTLTKRPVSKTPAPAPQTRGSPTGSKSLESKSPKELMVWLKSK